MNKHTKGPWEWQSWDGGKTVFLGTPDRGRMVVMDFVRQGMTSAQPRFAIREENMGGRMVKFEEWGDLDKSPDARLISAAPDLFEACELIHFAGIGLAGAKPKNPAHAAIWEQLSNAVTAARAAIAKASGE